jgi:hypothetical protein
VRAVNEMCDGPMNHMNHTFPLAVPLAAAPGVCQHDAPCAYVVTTAMQGSVGGGAVALVTCGHVPSCLGAVPAMEHDCC